MLLQVVFRPVDRIDFLRTTGSRFRGKDGSAIRNPFGKKARSNRALEEFIRNFVPSPYSCCAAACRDALRQSCRGPTTALARAQRRPFHYHDDLFDCFTLLPQIAGLPYRRNWAAEAVGTVLPL